MIYHACEASETEWNILHIYRSMNDWRGDRAGVVFLQDVVQGDGGAKALAGGGKLRVPAHSFIGFQGRLV